MATRAPPTMRVRYLRDFDFTPPEDRRVTWTKRGGIEETVRRTHGRRMIAEENAVEVKTPPRAKAQDPA